MEIPSFLRRTGLGSQKLPLNGFTEWKFRRKKNAYQIRDWIWLGGGSYLPVYTYNCICIYVYIFVYTYIFICMYIHVYKHNYMYIYINICLYTHTHTQQPAGRPRACWPFSRTWDCPQFAISSPVMKNVCVCI